MTWVEGHPTHFKRAEAAGGRAMLMPTSEKLEGNLCKHLCEGISGNNHLPLLVGKKKEFL